MGFTTQFFLFVFAPICFSTYYAVIFLERVRCLSAYMKKMRTKDIVLIIFSCGFYAWSCFDNIFKLIIYIMVIYQFARILQKSRMCKFYVKVEQERASTNSKRIYLSTIILFGVMSLVVFYLVYYKYTSAIVYVWNFLFGDSLVAHNLVAPLALSFITFSAISYLCDVYRQDATAGSFVDCALYILFFPKIVSGPIILWKNFQKQIEDRKISLNLIVQGINRIMIGFAKKVILADSFGNCIISMGTSNVDQITAAGALILYMLQIYYDFSGYSDIAIGLSNLFGFHCEANFNFPYRSKSITEFWRRWHISLGTWFKEYVYIPLGGNRVSLKVTLRNLFIVFMLTGLWHGCGKTYFLWGIINAFFIILERIVVDKRIYKIIPNYIKYICTMLIVMCFWQLFRFGDVMEVVNWFKIILGTFTFDKIYYSWKYFFDFQMVCFTVIGILGATILGNARIQSFYYRIAETKIGYIAQEIILIALFLLAILFMVNSTYSPFIYFQY